MQDITATITASTAGAEKYTFTGMSSNFMNEVREVWNHGLMGAGIGNLIAALVILAAFLILRGILARVILHKVGEWAVKSKNTLDDKIVPALIPPAQFIPIILGVFFAGQILGFEGDAAYFFGRIVRSMIAFTIFWTIYLAIEPLGLGMKNLERMLTRVMVQWIVKVVKMVVIFIGAAVLLEIWGIAVGPMLAGLGLFGAAIALGAQDFFKNLIAGMSLISERQFLQGDWILVEGVVEGTVEDIGFRSTTIRRFDKAPIYVPNSLLSDAVVTNFSRMTHRQIKYRFGVAHDTTSHQLRIIRDEILKFLEDRNDIYATKEDAPQTARVDSFSTTSIEFSINCFTKATDYASWVTAKEELVLKIKEIVEDVAKTHFAAAAPPVTINTLASNDSTMPQNVPGAQKSAKS